LALAALVLVVFGAYDSYTQVPLGEEDLGANAGIPLNVHACSVVNFISPKSGTKNDIRLSSHRRGAAL